jgi:hypothetical protein
MSEQAESGRREVHVLVECHGAVLQNVEVFESKESAARFFVEQMKGTKDGEPLDGFADVDESAFDGDAVAYAEVLYEAHREAFNQGDGDGTDWHWYETPVKP